MRRWHRILSSEATFELVTSPDESDYQLTLYPQPLSKRKEISIAVTREDMEIVRNMLIDCLALTK